MNPQHAQVIPFFILNHELDTGYLRRFVKDCAAAGVDGVFLHARPGLLTPYLSEKWFEAIEACVDEAKKRGIKAWLYDEMLCPSGVAGGKVVASNSHFAERHLRVKRHRLRGGRLQRVVLGAEPLLHAFLLPVRNGHPDPRAARDVTEYVGPVNDTWVKSEWDSRFFYPPKYAKVYDFPYASTSHPRAVFEADVPAGDWELRVFHEHKGGDFIEAAGDYVDVSNREATQKFIEVTHEVYRRRFESEFGKTIPGIFTDEPKFRNLLPWSDAIAAHWEDYRRDPRALLALARTEMSWPQRGEPPLPRPKLGNIDTPDARARMRYRATLLRLFRDNWARPISDWCAKHRVKFTGHISPEEEWVQEAAICGSIPQVLKTFHIPGCDLIIPAVGDRAHSILNFIPSMAVSVAAQQGRSQTLCELYGVSNYQFNLQDKKRIAEWLASFGINVFVNHCLFGWLDGYRKYDAPPTLYKPSTLWPHFRAWADNIRATANRLGPQGVRVDMVIVRPMRTIWRLGLDREPEARAIYEHAMRLILALQERGISFHWVDDLDLDEARVIGNSIRIGRAKYPLLVHFSGTLDPQATAAVDRLRRKGARILTDAEASRLPGPLRSRNGAIRAAQSKDGGWFCVNIDRRPQTFSLNGQPHRLDGYESRWIKHGEKPLAPARVVRSVRLASDWEMRPTTDNVIVLQQWSLNGRPTKLAPYYEVAPPQEVGPVEQAALGPVPVKPQMAQQKRLVYRTQFRCRGIRALMVVIEGETILGRWSATFNGKSLTNWKKIYRYDPTNREHSIHPRNGVNELTFTVTIDKTTDGMIDPCRLYGDFRVKNNVLIPGTTVHGSGDWTKLGFPHYSGTMIHAGKFQHHPSERTRVQLMLDRAPNDHVVVFLNGRHVGELLWSPWLLDITRGLRPGPNQLELHVSNTLYNLMLGKPRPSGLNGGVTLRYESL